MREKPKRHPELGRLYLGIAMAVVSLVAFRIYKLLSPRVETALDPTSRWSLLAVAMLNTLAIATLLFIVARSLAKLYFERRHGILGARIRTKLVLALLGVGILPSLLLYLMGRDFISKNLDRWFQPETQQMIQDSGATTAALRQSLDRRLAAAEAYAQAHPSTPVDMLRQSYGLDWVRKPSVRAPEESLSPGPRPRFDAAGRPSSLTTEEGAWIFRESQNPPLLLGVRLDPALAQALGRLERRALDAAQVKASRDTLEALPQNTFLLLTLLSIFAAVWTGLTLSRAISEPVKELADASHQVGLGNLDIRLPGDGADELGFLARSFNAMVDDLQTSRRAIENQAERLDRQRAYLGQLLEALPVGVLSWSEDGELRTFNPAARAWFDIETWRSGEPAWDLLQRHPRFGVLPDLLAEVRRTRHHIFREFRIGGEGEGRPIRAVVLPLTGGGELAVLEDLSELAQAEKRAAWQEVARRMAHEVKNPLTPIKLTAQRLLRRSRDGRLDPQTVGEGAETILTEVTSLLHLVDSFSRFAKLPAPVFRELDAVDLVRQVAQLYEPNHPRIQWSVRVPDSPVTALWDGDMIKRALINLVDNALGAQPEGGAITLALDPTPQHLILQVADAGPGISPEARERLFQPYFSTKKKGTGLGLAIVRRIAQDHHGEAFFEPLEPGCRFTLKLPR